MHQFISRSINESYIYINSTKKKMNIKHFHDSFISLRDDVWAHQTRLTPTLVIEVHVLSQENERSCKYVLRV